MAGCQIRLSPIVLATLMSDMYAIQGYDIMLHTSDSVYTQ